MSEPTSLMLHALPKCAPTSVRALTSEGPQRDMPGVFWEADRFQRFLRIPGPLAHTTNQVKKASPPPSPPIDFNEKGGTRN